MKKLGQIAKIRTGYPFRGSIDRVESGNCRLVQMGDVRADAGVVPDVQTRVLLPSGVGKHELHFGDVLFIARGNRNEAATFAGVEDNTVATPHLFVITPRESVEFGDYLTWFLNLPETQAKIHAMRMGSSVLFVPMAAFSQLEVPVPPVEVQNSIVALQELVLAEQYLLEEIGERRRELVNGMMREAVRRSATDGLTANSDSARTE